MALKNIIFDLGGVLINIDYNKTGTAFKSLGYDNFNEMYSQYTADELFSHLETGHTAEEAFFKTMQERSVHALDSLRIREAWNAMLLDFRVESFDFLETLKDKYDLYLLSNTNGIHKEAFDKIFEAQTGKKSIDDYFKKAYYSHKIGLRKPNESIFRFVLQDAGIAPEETLFIDDSANNIEAAEKLAIKVHLLRPDERIEDLVY